jgi:hypothetical protein
MKYTKKTATTLATIFMAVGIAGLVAAAGMVVSNVLEGSNVVPPAEEGATLSFVDSPTDYAGSVDWVNGGEALIGQSYSLGVRLEGHAAYSNVVVSIVIEKAGIATTDLSLLYYDGVEWLPLTFVAGVDQITSTFGPSEGFAISSTYNQTTAMALTYNTAGTYNADLTVITV